MQADNVRLRQESIERNIARSDLEKIGCWQSRSNASSVMPKPAMMRPNTQPNYACANNAKRLPCRSKPSSR